MLQHEQADRDQREYEHDRMNLFATANNQIKANVRNEAPEYSLGNREGQGNEDYSQKSRQTFLYFPKIDVADALEHRRAYQNQNRRSRVHGHHSGERRQKEARQEAERRKYRGHSGAPATIDSRNALDVGRARRCACESGSKGGQRGDYQSLSQIAWITVFVEQIRGVCDADKRRNRVEQVGEEDADDCGQKRKLEGAENVQLQKHSVEVRWTKDSRRRFDLSCGQCDQRHDENTRQVGESTTAN